MDGEINMRCSDCDGKGCVVDYNGIYAQCSKCNGTGYMTDGR